MDNDRKDCKRAIELLTYDVSGFRVGEYLAHRDGLLCLPAKSFEDQQY